MCVCALFQIPYLAEGVRIHGEKVTEALRPFHERLEACFKQLKEKVEKQYGVRSLVRTELKQNKLNEFLSSPALKTAISICLVMINRSRTE